MNRLSISPILITVLFALVACDGRTLIGSPADDLTNPDANSSLDGGALQDAVSDGQGLDAVQQSDASTPPLGQDSGPPLDSGPSQMCAQSSAACGSVCCDPQQACVQGQCLESCPVDLPNMCKQRCTDFDNDPWNCGGCGTVCPQKYECVAGTCQEVD